MKKKVVCVSNRMGVHARPSSRIAKTASLFASRIDLGKNGAQADAKSIIAVMGLAMQQGDFVEIMAEGVDETDAVEAIANLFAAKSDEQHIFD